ncbi:L-rhamnose ABC transporter, transmembrane component 2 [Klebsiella pneumoniae]|uniref:L-rhamnose ABC transporter, transmembrane component 2 n=1 Tax=Klebsiella pneumoniae TaxID=573 RepID=A0A377XLX9_KLEPN|nr:L-rhamnose ABC transporter, transmembrane component 2 [Klebsiella pneumoniae]STV67524.1 L-rhamnose ABC transporter, transmembrane component 2 [Klebsiella pneumoniae subsp. rhinoscleromatis]STT82954.1 L-rhamnose ABC transporter, transmembrane component 2 [Klebsiella pneumoniae]STU09628.1 L-rhamnose ABC transporter, transmembrane component 2 [Klebsiella pneumoniae]STW11435.1 L-rhamnose ABC transporter, transmembrane component 2 [Klebsiella pneumoniae subsp. rhinoscleromatis]
MMGHAWLKHREALLAVVIILMIGAIGRSFHRAIWWRCLTIPPSLSSSPSAR